jgi:hypothetical protein
MLFNRIYMIGPAFASREGEARRAAAPRVLAAVESQVELPTDDWPYLYLPGRRLGSFYISIMLAIALIAVAGLLWASPDLVRSLGRRRPIDGEMFLFGLAFLLLETRSVTAMNLAWGATWLTSAVVFFAVLITVLAATLATRAWPLKHKPTLVALVATLLLVYALPESVVLHEGMWGRLALSVLVVGTPLFLSSICFARAFEARAAVDVAFGWNLLGAVAGGLLELISMAVGLKALLLVAAVAYLGALWLVARLPRSETSQAVA